MTHLDETWELIKKGKKGKNIGIKTGFTKLDSIIGGLQPSRYIVYCASSSAGKTSFYLHMLYNILYNMKDDHPVYFLVMSLEISPDVILAKLMALYCAEEFGIYLTINDSFSFEQEIDDYSYDCLAKAKEWLNTKMKYLKIIDSAVNAKVVYSQCIKFAKEHGKLIEDENGNNKFIPANENQLLLCIIDHLNLVMPDSGHTLKQEIDLISSYLVTLKKKLKMTFWALMQQNRDASSVDRKKMDLQEIQMNDTKDSGNPVQDSDIVIGLFYPFKEKLTTYRGYRIIGAEGTPCLKTLRSHILLKNRYGVTDQVIPMCFYGRTGYFIEIPKPDEIPDITKYYRDEDNIPLRDSLNNHKDEIAKDFSVEPLTENKSTEFKF